MKNIFVRLSLLLLALPAGQANAQSLDHGAISRLIAEHDVPGLAVALTSGATVVDTHAYGYADLEAQTPLRTDSVLYGASWTKSLFSMFVMQQVEAGLLDLDTPIEAYLKKPLPEYRRFTDLADEPRWRTLTMRMLLGHTTGFPNYRFFPPWSNFDPNGTLEFFRDPGVAYGYSGEGYYIAQQVMDDLMGGDSGAAMAAALFEPLGLKSTVYQWDERLRPQLAKTYTADGKRYRRGLASDFAAAGSVDTTIDDMAALFAAYMGGGVLSDPARAEMLRPHTEIQSAHQFPPWHPKTDARNKDVNLASAVGFITWIGPRGPAFAKGGHDDGTDNMLICLIAERTCALAMMTTAKGGSVYPDLFKLLLPGHGYPWRWEYGNFNTDEDA